MLQKFLDKWNILFLGSGKSLEWKSRVDLSKVEVMLTDMAGRRDRQVQGQSTTINELLLLEKWLCQVSLGCTAVPEWLKFLESLVRSLTASSPRYYIPGMQTEVSYKFRTRSAGRSSASYQGRWTKLKAWSWCQVSVTVNVPLFSGVQWNVLVLGRWWGLVGKGGTGQYLWTRFTLGYQFVICKLAAWGSRANYEFFSWLNFWHYGSLLICACNISAVEPNLAAFPSGVPLVHWCRDYVNLQGMDDDLVTPPKIPGVILYQSLEQAEYVLLDVLVC